jgi:hypothetical protein
MSPEDQIRMLREENARLRAFMPERQYADRPAYSNRSLKRAARGPIPQPFISSDFWDNPFGEIEELPPRSERSDNPFDAIEELPPRKRYSVVAPDDPIFRRRRPEYP